MDEMGESRRLGAEIGTSSAVTVGEEAIPDQRRSSIGWTMRVRSAGEKSGAWWAIMLERKLIISIRASAGVASLMSSNGCK